MVLERTRQQKKTEEDCSSKQSNVDTKLRARTDNKIEEEGISEDEENGNEIHQDKTETQTSNMKKTISDGEKEQTKVDVDTLTDILSGNIDIKLPSNTRIVRIFTSSTFTDTFHERNTLMVKIYPKLKEYCQARGFDFQVVDMRWGIRDEATADHMTTELCLKELKACQKLSTGPNFITFLGQKYGYRPFPSKIYASEFEALLAEVKEQSDTALLQEWFLLDENAINPTYMLQPITDLLPNYNNQSATKTEREKASETWKGIFKRIQVILRQASINAFKHDTELMKKYCISVTENEITKGILEQNNPEKCCFWFKRNITDINGYINSEENTQNFIDIINKKLDKDASDHLEELRLKKIPKHLSSQNVKEYNLRWHGKKGIDPENCEQHASYLKTLCQDFYNTLVQMINKGITERKILSIDDTLIQEICQHTKTCQEKSRLFYGREDELQQVENYLTCTSIYPLVIYGPSGCGKTALMAKAATISKHNHSEKIQVTRFLGTTLNSSTLNKLLHSICCQIQRVFGRDTNDVPTNTKELVEFLQEQFEYMNENTSREIILFLDSIDQLSPDDGAFLMKWLPKEFPSCVKIIISTLPDAKFEILKNLQLCLSEQSLLKIPKLPTATANNILKAWFTEESRRLTISQSEIVLNGFQKCPLPLFLVLCCNEAVRWKSYTDSKHTVLQSTIKDAIDMLFSRMETLHGKTLVSHALGLLTSSKHGLSDAEIDDILSIDDDVLNDVYQYWTPPIRRIPPLLWLRIRADLQAYIVTRGSNGTLVNMWYHRQFIEAATDRYLSDDKKLIYHAILSEYFLGMWSNGKLKSFVDNEKKSHAKDRLVPAQPSVYMKEDGSKDIYNYRKLSELPHHLIQSNNLEALKKNVLFNFDFLWAKIHAFGFRYLLEDVDQAEEHFADDKDVKLIHEFFKMSARILLHSLDQLPFQITGRMHGLKSPYIQILVNEARLANVPCMYSLNKCFEAPLGLLKHSFAGHVSKILCTTMSLDQKQLISAGKDRTIRIWDLSNGQQLKCVNIEGDEFPSMIFAVDAASIVVVFQFHIIMQNLQTEEVYYNMPHDSSFSRNSSDITKDRGHLLILGNKGITVYKCQPKTLEVKCFIEEESRDVDIVRVCGSQYAYTRGSKNVFVRNLGREDFRKDIQTPSENIRIFTFNQTGDKFVLLGDSDYKPKELCLHIYDSLSWMILRTLKSNNKEFIFNVRDAVMFYEHFVWSCKKKISFWNIETGERGFRQGDQTQRYQQVLFPDDKTMVTVSQESNNNSIKAWDLDALEIQTISEDNHREEGEEVMYSHPSNDIAISLSKDDTLKIWNTATQTLQKIVKIKNVNITAIKFVDDLHILMWDAKKGAVLAYDFLKDKFISTSSEKNTCSFESWVLCHQTHEYLMFDEQGKYFIIYDWRTGKRAGVMKTNWNRGDYRFPSNSDGSRILVAEKTSDNNKGLLTLTLFDTVKRTAIGQLPYQNVSYEDRMTEDGNYFICFAEVQYRVNIWDLETFNIAKTIEYEKINKVNVADVHSFSSSSRANCMVVCFKLEGFDGDILQQKLVAYRLHSWEKLSEINVGGIIKMYDYSADGMKVLTGMGYSPTMKSWDLFDLSQVNNNGNIVKIASFVPEVTPSFGCIAKNGGAMCLGIPGVKDVSFFLPCGPVKNDARNRSRNDVEEINVICPFYPSETDKS